MTKAKKPPTQVAGVEGIAPKPVTMNDQPERTLRVDMVALIKLPPFQMYTVERGYLSQGEIEMATGFQGPNTMRVMQNLVTRAGNDLNALYDDYCQWHRDKGYWPNESPAGELLVAEEK